MAGRPIKRMIVKASALASLKRLETFPTQPFPLKPPPLARNSYKPEDLVTANDTNETHAKTCQALVEQSGGAYNQGPYTPWVYRPDGGQPRSSVSFPGITGGTNWGGTATDPRSGYVYVFTKMPGTLARSRSFPRGAIRSPT